MYHTSLGESRSSILPALSLEHATSERATMLVRGSEQALRLGVELLGYLQTGREYSIRIALSLSQLIPYTGLSTTAG